MPERFGFAGLGQMGAPMAGNIAGAKFPLTVYDKAGTAARFVAMGAPETATPVESLEELVRAAETVFLSLPDGPATVEFAKDLTAIDERAVTCVIDLSTIGPEAAKQAHGIYENADISYIDAPVSGGQSGARDGTITVMWAGPEDILKSHRAVMMSMCKNLFHVGDAAGQGQAVKLLNNFLSGTAMAATSEAMTFAVSQGLDMQKVLDVVNVSTGQNTATSDKFPNRIVTGTYDAGFKTTLLAKDIRLFLENTQSAGTPSEVASTIADLWRRCDEALPNSDFTRIYEFVQKKDD